MERDATSASLDLTRLRQRFRAGELTAAALVDDVLGRIGAAGDDKVWIARVPEDALRARAASLDALAKHDRRRAEQLPLFGIPFAVKDNIDVAGMSTTAACPDFAYEAAVTAPAVVRLEQAGAILIGKTNLDQFATGLVGCRSPYGVPRNPFDPRFIPGGSSAGSAVAVAAGLVSFALGTDTAITERVVSEVADSFLNFGVVARREAEQQAELATRPDVLATVPYFEADVVDMDGLLRLGAAMWG